ncbi:uncharacterized protein LOC121647331 isoform X1 [Melanotaenia boesemani]|uniref:uncharacterized protein LOC121647331 isoform X1 n=1 Tax=Melanotaenia boesemani TaxID=1250792 RepID=UPI001C043552|nr:uncharacterized protein LOC121647331 isoform X1 [Melanotaenia boesemani]
MLLQIRQSVHLCFQSDEDDVSQSSQRLSRGRSGGRSRGRARGFRVRGRGRGRGTRAVASRAEHSDRVEQYRRDHLAATQRLLDDMTAEYLRRLASQLVVRQPGLIFDLLLQQSNSSVSEAAGVPGMPWCTCGLCREMPTDRERICCGQTPANCISKLPHFTQYCLDEGYLRIHRHYREDVTALGHATEPGDNRQYRYAAYRHFI